MVTDEYLRIVYGSTEYPSGAPATFTCDTVRPRCYFDEPVFNYTREFPFIWEEMSLPISYRDDRSQAERILLEAARKHAVKMSDMSAEAGKTMRQRFGIDV